MSYLGYIKPIIEGYPATGDLAVIEIGIDQGHSTLAIVQNLVSKHERSVYLGCDIKFNKVVGEQMVSFRNVLVKGIDSEELISDPSVPGCRFSAHEINSIEWLENVTKLIPENESNGFVDIAFIDGDHNYYTVSKELNLVKKILKPESIILCDDYNGKWATRDGFYSEAESHKDISAATPRKSSEKEGVKNAVNDFLIENPNWRGWSNPNVDPILLYRGDVWANVFLPRKDYELFSRCVFKFEKHPDRPRED